MRLLTLDEHGDLAWAEFSQDKIPPYAILSHTWEFEEVTFLDLIKRNYKSKAGYRKILFCGEQAARDNLSYFWVDTCCIDKSNNTELTKAINSMFRWYRNAVKCYAYFSDVSVPARDATMQDYQSTWEAGFRSSRWFTRGWTLQELLAPASVIFYSSQFTQLGDKKSLAALIQETTGIPMSALKGQALDSFNVEERMQWAAKRQTTEAEDGAYCLLGIFNVFMPLIYGEGKDSALKRLRREVDGLPSAKAATSFMLPLERNPRFVGRESILATLEGKLFMGEQTTKMAIVGLGGIGKTQLAIELAFRTRVRYQNCSVFWIPATDMESLHQAYRDVARQLHIPGCDEDKADIKKLVQDYLSRVDTRPWLLVIDNADDISMWIHSSRLEQGSGGLKEYLPKSKQGCIVFTTRDKKTAIKLVGQSIVEIPELDEDVAVQLLRKSLIDPSLIGDQEDAKTLLKELAYLPLAIVQAAAYINENSMTLRDYVSLIDEQEGSMIELLSEEFEDDGRYSTIKNPVATTWLVSFERIRRLDPMAADYLSFMACIDRRDIPQSLLPVSTARKKVVEAIGTLKAYSFIIDRDDELVFDIHRLVHLATRNWLRKESTLTRWAQAAIERLNELCQSSEHQHRAQWRLLPHAAYALRQEVVDQDSDRRLNLMAWYAYSLRSDGRYKEATGRYEELIEAQKRVLGEEHPDTLDALGDLAVTYRRQGRWRDAEKLNLQLVQRRKQMLGEENPDTLISMNSLANTYLHQGRYKEAEDLLVQVVETSKRLFGEEYLTTQKSLVNLASTYQSQERWGEAEELEIRVIETRKRLLGEEHPDTLMGMHNLASTYTNQGRRNEAIELEMRVIEGRKRLFGEDHPSTLLGMGSLAVMYDLQGKLDEAEELEVRVVETMKRVLGEEHPDTLTNLHNLAFLWKQQGRDEEAVELMAECVRRGTRVLGSNHPRVLTSSSVLDQWRSEE